MEQNAACHEAHNRIFETRPQAAQEIWRRITIVIRKGQNLAARDSHRSVQGIRLAALRLLQVDYRKRTAVDKRSDNCSRLVAGAVVDDDQLPGPLECYPLDRAKAASKLLTAIARRYYQRDVHAAGLAKITKNSPSVPSQHLAELAADALD